MVFRHLCVILADIHTTFGMVEIPLLNRPHSFQILLIRWQLPDLSLLLNAHARNVQNRHLMG